MSRHVRTFAAHVALVAILLRAFLPAGWMPNPATTGAPFVICTMHGALHLPSESTGQKNKAPAEDPAHHNDICPFAAAVHLAAPTSGGVYVAPSLKAARIEFSTPPRTVASHTAYSPQSPRAPPRFA